VISAPVTSWQDQRRLDKAAQARIELELEETRSRVRIAEQQAQAQARLTAAGQRDAARQARRYARAARRSARRAARSAWLTNHLIDLLFVPVIAVPGVLAWTGMADYGFSEYGTPGLALPGLSEGGMWVFAAATTITRNRHPDRPVWHLRLGTLIFAVYGASLNFLHGLTVSGPLTGAMMALVSVAGVTVHQLVTAGPRRSPADRDRARLNRWIAHRERAARRAAVRHAPVEIDDTGTARLVFEARKVTVTRRRGRVRLDESQAARPGDGTPAPLDGTPAARQRVLLLRWSPDWAFARLARPAAHIAQPAAQTAQPPAHSAPVSPAHSAQNSSQGDRLPATENENHGNVDNPDDDEPDDDSTERDDDTDRDDDEETAQDALAQARRGMRATALAGNPFSQRQLIQRYGVSRTDAKAIYDQVIDGNGGIKAAT
jgi:hypothetical protein